MNYISEIKPVYNITSNNRKLISNIEELLTKIEIRDINRLANLKMESKVRSIHSSLAIENNNLSLDTIYDIICFNKKVLGSYEDIQEVRNANELYNQIKEYNWKNEKDLIRAHIVLMKYFEDDEGYYRKHGEGVKIENKLIYKAPDSLIVPVLMKSLFDFINNNNTHPFILSAIFHYYLVYIHPFTDGNGRIARFWVSLILIDYNKKFEYIPIEEEIYKTQDEYYKAIENSHNDGNANSFINYMLETIYNYLLKTTQKTTQKINLNNNQQKIIKLIENNPSITRKEIAKEINLTEDGVKYNLNKLKKSKIIERVGPDKGGYWTVNKRSDNYEI